MKTVLVTGGVRGIGKSIALAFQKKGYRVCVSYSKDEASADGMRACGFEVYRADVSKEEEVLSLFEKIGGVDILVNNAGVALFSQIQDTSFDDYKKVFSVNMDGAFLCAREASKSMISKKSGESVYSASKAALIGFTKALAKELGYSGIRVNAVSPGVINTAMNARFSKEDISLLQEEIPLGRLGEGEDIAKAVLFLEENDYITGIDLPVNGGFSIV